MKILRAYKTEIDPNNVQRTALLRSAGTARFAYNWGLSQKKAALAAKSKVPNAIELHRQWNALKPSMPWIYESSKCCGQEALRNLDRAFDNFFKGRKSKRKVGFPKFKSKRNGIGSFRLTGTIKVFEKSVQLPVLGAIRLKEAGYIPTSDVKILSATVSEHAGHWFCSIQVEQDIPDTIPAKDAHPIIGVDLGIKTLAVCSDGQTFENPKALRKRLKKLKRFQRAVSRKQKGSNNRRKANRKVANLHYRISCIRKDTLHKITSHLTKTKSVIGIEDLNVSGMMKNHCLAQAISDLGLFEWRRQLEYKGEWNHCLVAAADRFYPSSRTCSHCGLINEKLTLSDREWVCECGAVHDRDFNASRNLEVFAASSSEKLNACEGRGPLACRKAG
jgi:putative transposase